MSRRKHSDEYYVIALCNYILKQDASHQHCFDFIKGDPDKNGKGRSLPVDAYYPVLSLVIEYHERQHYEPVAHFDKRHRTTVSGVHRGLQRQIYHDRKKQKCLAHGLDFMEISYRSFTYDSRKRIIRNLWYDISILRGLLSKYLLSQHNASNLQPIFSRNPDVNRMAFMNWRIERGDGILNMKNMADGFMDAALELATSSLTDNSDKKADILIFPIFNNANHAIELYLKSMIWTIHRLTRSNKRFKASHHIGRIFTELLTMIEQYKAGLHLSVFNKATESLHHYIEELTQTIQATEHKDKMDFSRYPFDIVHQDHFYVLERGTAHVDLENFLDRFTVISLELKRFFDFLYWRVLHKQPEE